MTLSKEKATPSKSDRTESSVLFSLRELRRLEDERVRAEADARRAKAEAERRARAEAEQRGREEQARRVREDEERRQRAESEREDRLRVEEVERRARVEGEIQLRERQRLEEQRQRQLQGRRVGRSAWMAAAVVTTLCLTVGGGLAAWTSQQHQAERKALEQELARRGEQMRAAQLAFDARIRALEEMARSYPGDARTANESASSPADPQRPKPPAEPTRPRPPHRTGARSQPAGGPPPSPFRVPHKPEIGDEPLGGLPDEKSGGF